MLELRQIDMKISIAFQIICLLKKNKNKNKPELVICKHYLFNNILKNGMAFKLYLNYRFKDYLN